MIRTHWTRFWDRCLSASIQVKIMGLAVGLVLLLGIGAMLETRAVLVSNVGAELDKRGTQLAHDLAARTADPLLTRNILQVHQALKDTLANNEDVRYVFIQDAQGRVLAHTFSDGFPTDLLKTTPPMPQSPGTDLPVRLFQTEEGVIHEAGSVVSSADIGIVRIGMSETGLHLSVGRIERNLLLALVVLALLATLVAWGLTRLITNPVLALVGSARKAAHGDLTEQVSVRFQDEVGELVNAFNQMLGSLAKSGAALEANAKIRTELLQKVMTAQEDERKRIARELHDETGQAITSLMVGMKLVEQVADDPDEVRSRSTELRVLAARTLESVRQLSRQLRPSVLDDAGLVAALRRHISDFARFNGLSVDFQVVGDESRRLPPEVETAAYRIVQEALTNVARHARAKNASIILDLSGDVISTVVEDDGVGFDPAQIEGTSGVLGMRERAVLLGGSLTIESAPETGTTIYAKLPVRGELEPCAS
jgi:signal transduction histidine kinase